MRQLISRTEAINLGCAQRISQVVSRVSVDTSVGPWGPESDTVFEKNIFGQ